MQKLLATCAVLLVSTASVGCSSDSKDPVTDGTGAASGTGGASATGGSAGAGGSSASGGSTASGGAATGGAATGGGTSYDPAKVAACGIGDTSCLSCLAVSCCDLAKACFADAGCSDAFDTYQACMKATPEDGSKCFSVFANTVRGDGGDKTHEPLLQCIFNFADPTKSCGPCGVPAAF